LKILVIGSGAREHAIVWKLSQSPKVSKIFAAPGNAGTASLAQNLALASTDIDALLTFALAEQIDLTVVGPEAPLAGGIVDAFNAEGLKAFGPTKDAARIEASKVFSKDLMEEYGIPCACGKSFTDFNEAKKYVISQGAPIVVKADGLAAGKGVIVAATTEEALAALNNIMNDKAFGEAGSKVLVEEVLIGKEMSFFVFCDGETVAPSKAACDYKRIYAGGKGPNTGGMGSYCPPIIYNTTIEETIMESVIKPTVKALKDKGSLYKGVLYVGLMLTEEGPKVLEFNARFGDPETQVVLPLLKTDLLTVMLAVVEGKLKELKLSWHEGFCVGVVMASEGYPASYPKGLPISGLKDLPQSITVFHAGTALKNGMVVTNSGRVLTVTARAATINDAREIIYANIDKINFEGRQYRRDIALFKENS